MNAQELMHSGRRFVYYLDQSSPPQTQDKKLAYRVSIVFENEPGHFPTGDNSGLKEPWFWTEETCKARNKELGYDELQVDEIVTSSMFPHRQKAQ